jgi:hypothetical protein
MKHEDCCPTKKTKKDFYWRSYAPTVKVDWRCKKCLIKHRLEHLEKKKEENKLYSIL